LIGVTYQRAETGNSRFWPILGTPTHVFEKLNTSINEFLRSAEVEVRVSRRQAHPGSWRKDRDPDSDCPPLRHSAPSRTELEVGLNIPEAPLYYCKIA
jgi:hypothetical protein